MPMTIDAERLLSACADDALDDGILIDADLQPLAGREAPSSQRYTKAATTSWTVAGRLPAMRRPLPSS